MALNTLPNAGLTNRGYPSDRIVTPIIINGDMSVAQRGTSAASLTGSGYNTCDRWRMSASSLGTFTQSQSTTVPTGQGFSTSLKMDCTTADASPGASDLLMIQNRLEGQNLQSLKKGTSSAEVTTISFWVRSNKTGTYTLEIFDNDNSRHISKTYTIDSANTWEKKIVSYAGDTSGTLGNDANYSIALQWWLGAGSNYTSGTLATSWASQTTANKVSSSQVNLADSTSNEWYVTGVQWEVGEFDSTSIPSFPFESFESNLRKCQRYYFCSDTVSSGTEFHPCFCGSSGNTPDSIKFTAPVSLRSPDNVTITASAGTSQLVGGGYSSTTTVPTFTRRSLTNDVDGTTKPSGSGTKIYFVTNALFSGISEGYAGFGTTGKLEFDNEL